MEIAIRNSSTPLPFDNCYKELSGVVCDSARQDLVAHTLRERTWPSHKALNLHVLRQLPITTYKELGPLCVLLSVDWRP
jgi:hypothetical protein